MALPLGRNFGAFLAFAVSLVAGLELGLKDEEDSEAPPAQPLKMSALAAASANAASAILFFTVIPLSFLLQNTERPQV